MKIIFLDIDGVLNHDQWYVSKEYQSLIEDENTELDIFGLFEKLGFKKKKYYRVRNEAITLISETMFGVLAGEHGFADLGISNGNIHVIKKKQ